MADAVDVLMRIVSKGAAIPGESRTAFLGTDSLRTDFEAGRFCELKNFSFAAGLAASLSRGKDEEEDEETENEADAGREEALKREKKKLMRVQERKAAKRGEAGFADMQPVQFTRILDASSTLLFKALIACETLDSIAVVKRKAAGTRNSGACYLRLDFTKVLMTKLDWEDGGHVMTETGTFIYRELKMRYRPQKDDGSLGTTIESSWKMKAAT